MSNRRKRKAVKRPLQDERSARVSQKQLVALLELKIAAEDAQVDYEEKRRDIEQRIFCGARIEPGGFAVRFEGGAIATGTNSSEARAHRARINSLVADELVRNPKKRVITQKELEDLRMLALEAANAAALCEKRQENIEHELIACGSQYERGDFRPVFQGNLLVEEA